MPFQTHLRVLPSAQRTAWPHLGPSRELGFCLYGGTALALRFAHRKSVDFDFFSDLPLDKGALLRAMPLLKRGTVLQEAPNTLVLLVPTRHGRGGEVKLSFCGGLDFGRVGRPELTDDGVLQVASTRDLLATKLKVLFDRVEAKDYVDIHELLRHRLELAQGLSDARALYPQFPVMDCLKILAWFGTKELASLRPECKKALARAAADALMVKRLPPSRVRERSLGLTPDEEAEDR